MQERRGSDLRDGLRQAQGRLEGQDQEYREARRAKKLKAK
jgi:hypothetical protein